MAKPKAVPDSSSRESPAFWMQMVNGSDKRRQYVNDQYVEFARWFEGDMSGMMGAADADRDGPRRRESFLENMTHLATVASMADLFFRWPRFVVRPPYTPPKPMVLPGMPQPPVPPSVGLFTPELARIETMRLAYTMRAVGYRKKARRALQDALLGSIGILKVTADPELVLDEDAVAAAREEAFNEVTAFLQSGIRMKASEEQLHSIHIQVKRSILNEKERDGTIDRSALKYLRKHIEFHASMMGSERMTETIRSNTIRIRRVNPLDYFYDPTVDDREDASWRGQYFLLRKQDVVGNEDYDKEAREQVGRTEDRWARRTTWVPRIRTMGTFDIPEDMIAIYEIYDLVEQRRILFAEGGSIPLQITDRGDLAVIQPSGPFQELAFVEDALEGQGVPPPNAYKEEQKAATQIASANVKAAIQSMAKTMFDARTINPEDAQRIWHANVGEMIPVNPKGDFNRSLKDAFEQVPPSEIHEQNLVVQAGCVRGIERRSGLGVAKLGGGEQAPTATGAALGADASSSISEDRSASVDEWSEQTARHVVRLERRYTPKSQIVETCGPEAIEVWPERWGLGDVANDIGVEIIPGSSRRRNTAVDQKQLLDGLQAFSADPMMQGPAAGKLKLSMYQMYFEDGGVTGLDWSGVKQEIEQQAMLQQMQMAGMGAGMGGQPGEAPPETAPKENAPEMSQGGGTSENDVAQGVANVGGGRIPTGASIGDRVAKARGGALAREANRG